MQLHIDIYIWCAFQIFVFLKLASNVALQARARMITKIAGYPEDARGRSRVADPDPANPAELPLARAVNLFRNDLENVIPFSLIALAAAFAAVDAQLYIVLLVIFAAARISHAVCLIGGRQPYRAISYLVGQVCALVLMVLLLFRLIPIFQSY